MGALIGAPLKFMDVLRILSAKSYSQLLFDYAILNSTNKKRDIPLQRQSIRNITQNKNIVYVCIIYWMFFNIKSF